MTNMNWFDTLIDLVFGKPKQIVNEVNLKFLFYSEKPELSPLNLSCKTPILYELQTETKQLRQILQNNLVNALMFVYQDITELLYIFLIMRQGHDWEIVKLIICEVL